MSTVPTFPHPATLAASDRLVAALRAAVGAGVLNAVVEYDACLAYEVLDEDANWREPVRDYEICNLAEQLLDAVKTLSQLVGM